MLPAGFVIIVLSKSVKNLEFVRGILHVSRDLPWKNVLIHSWDQWLKILNHLFYENTYSFKISYLKTLYIVKSIYTKFLLENWVF